MNSILTQIAGSFENPCEVLKLVAEGKQLVKKRQTLIKIADRNKEGWRLAQEYESDDLASDSKDEKKLRKAKRAMERKRKEVKGIGGDKLEKFKSSSDSQLFRSKIPLFIAFKKYGPIRNLKKKPNVFSKEEQIGGELMN